MKLLTAIRYLLFALGVLGSLPLVVVLLLIVRAPLSFLGTIYLLGYFLIVLGMFSAPEQPRRSSILLSSGLVLGLIALTIRIGFPPSGSRVTLIALPSQSKPRLLSRILNEQDAVLLGTQIAPYVAFVSPSEEQSLVPAFRETYREMHQQGVTPLSPFLPTYLNLQKPNEFDALVAEPEPGLTPTNAILFLHGYGGNFTVQCWLVAKAGFQIDALTVCPSTSVNGQWWNAQGQAILRETMTYLHQRGVQRIYLAGLSNGAIGASRLADRYQGDLAGLILISGADPSATMTALPTLVLHGRNDGRIPVSLIEQYVSVAGPNTTYYEFDSDHFLLLKQASPVQEVIASWLREQESNFQAK